MNNDKKSGNFWIGFFLGGLFGAFLIFLLGTKEGKRVTDQLLQKGELFEEELEQKVNKLQKKGEDLLSNVKDVKEQVIKEVTEGKKAVSDSMVAKIDQALTKIEDIQKKGTALTEEVHHHYFKKNGKTLSS